MVEVSHPSQDDLCSDSSANDGKNLSTQLAGEQNDDDEIKPSLVRPSSTDRRFKIKPMIDGIRSRRLT